MSGEIVTLPVALEGVPPLPPKAMDPHLDAAARCFARYGVRRTTIQDIAREAGVSRATAYRQLGSVTNAALLLLSRDLNRLLSALPSRLSSGPDALASLFATVVEEVRRHPVAAKVLADEPEIIGPYITRHHNEVISRVRAVVEPLLRSAAGSGLLRRFDPSVAADVVVRLGISLVLAPPPGDVARYARQVLLPLLSAQKEARSGRSR